MTKLQRLIKLRDSLQQSILEVESFIELQLNRKYTEGQSYEQRKARGLCVGTKTCRDPIVKGKTLCEKHLRKAARSALARFNRIKNGPPT